MNLNKIFLFGILLLQGTLFAQFEGNQTPTYPKLVAFYDSLAKLKQVELYNMGKSDYGLPVYLCVLNGERDSAATFSKSGRKGTILVNNGIHPGEPDGINACGKLTLDYVTQNFKLDKDVIFSFILCYNVDGMMNRSSSSRANQDGPEEYGFRGNAQNLDLNRDFIKMDSENAFTFARIFQAVQPDVFIDTHVSNGADYQYTLTVIHSMKERLLPSIARLTYDHFVPELEKAMKKHRLDVFPYVELAGKTPVSGLEAFNDLPRYAMGYATLFPCISLTTETHMLKPFPQRVEATYLYLKEIADWTGNKLKTVKGYTQKAEEELGRMHSFHYRYERTPQKDSIRFKGFEHGYKKSAVTGLDRLYYDRSKPYERYIPHYKTFRSMDSVKIPKYYIVEGQCHDVIRRLEQNKVYMRPITSDSTIEVTSLRVRNFKSPERPYEGHFLHSGVEIGEQLTTYRFKAGDMLIPSDQQAKAFICSVLEPEAEDSYFAWNFFDSYLQEKEYFSDYVFEDLAAEILDQSAEMRSLFDAKKERDPQFAGSQWEQLYWIYQNSKYFEPSFMRLPVFRIEN
ncbi:MAG: hypothetical protein ACO1O6_03415 [Bacteroidota bacterium]